MTYEPAIVQQWAAPNDTNGNPRRCFVIWAADGTLLDAIDEGYSGRPNWTKSLTDLGRVDVSATQYRYMIKNYSTEGKRS